MKIIKYIHVVRLDSYRKFIVLYDDGTWEELFRFRWNNIPKIDGKLFLKKTRSEAIEIYDRLINKIEA